MNDAIHRAAQPGATASSVLNTPAPARASAAGAGAAAARRQQQQQRPQQPVDPPPIHSLEDPADSDAYFASLLNRPSILSPRGAVGLLALAAPYFVSTVAPADDEGGGGSDVEADVEDILVAVDAVDRAGAGGAGGGEGKEDDGVGPHDESHPPPPAPMNDRGATPEQCALYLRAVAEHGPSLGDAIRGGGGGIGVGGGHPDAGCAFEAVRAAGCAAVACGPNRMDVSTSGVIPALARLVDAAGGGVADRKKNDGGGGSGNGVITAVHPELMQCCIAAGQYRYASNFARSHPVRVAAPPAKSSGSSSSNRGDRDNPGANCQVDCEQFLRYFYLLGMVRCGCGDFDGAVEAFDVCVAMPSRMVSAVTIAARKKLLLAACLSKRYSGFHKGEAECLALFDPSSAAQPAAGGGGGGAGGGTAQVEQTGAGGGNGGGGASSTSAPSSSSSSSSPYKTSRAFSKWPYAVPPSASNAVSTFLASGGWGLREYDRLASSFLRGDVSSFVSARGEMARVLSEDGNAGLAAQLEEALGPRAVRKVAAVYEAIPLDGLAARLGRYLPPSASSSASSASSSGSCRIRGGETIEDWAVRVVGSAAASSSGGGDRGGVGGGGGGGIGVRADFAKIDQADGTVYFHPLPPSLATSPSASGVGKDLDAVVEADAVARELSGRIRDMAALAERVRDLDVAVATSSGYQAAVARESSSKVAGAGGGGGGGQQQQASSSSRTVAEAGMGAGHGHGPGGYRPEYMGR